LNSINTNTSASQALSTLNASASQLAQAQNAVSTGLSIASPSDNGAVWAIAQNLRSQVSSWATVASGLNRAQSIVDVAAAATSSITNILQTIKQDAISLNDPSLDSQSQATLQSNIQQLLNEVDQTANSASFDGVNLLTPTTEPAQTLSAPSGGPNPTLSFQASTGGQPGVLTLDYSLYNVDPNAPDQTTLTATGVTTNASQTLGAPGQAGQTENLSSTFQYGDWSDFSATNPASVGFSFDSTRFPASNVQGAPQPPAAYGVTVQSLTLTAFRTNEQVLTSPDGSTQSLVYHPITTQWLGLTDLTTLAPSEMVQAVDQALSQANTSAEYLGAQQNLLTDQVNQAANMQDVITTGVGDLVDANLAKESATLQASKVKEQLALQALSIANTQPQSLLGLFR